MVTIEHKISADEVYRYKDHTLSERPGFLAAGSQHVRQSEPKEQEQHPDGRRRMSDGSYRRKKIESMTPEGRCNYAKELDILCAEKSVRASTLAEKVEVMKLKIEMAMLQKIIMEDEETAGSSPVPALYMQHVHAQAMYRETQFCPGAGAQMQTEEEGCPHAANNNNTRNIALPQEKQPIHQQWGNVRQAGRDHEPQSSDSSFQPAQEQTAPTSSRGLSADTIPSSDQSPSDPRQRLRSFFDELKSHTENKVKHPPHRSPFEIPADFGSPQFSPFAHTIPALGQAITNYYNPIERCSDVQLRSLEQQNKERLARYRFEQDVGSECNFNLVNNIGLTHESNASGPYYYPHPEGSSMQTHMNTAATPTCHTPASGPNVTTSGFVNHALQDYQMQLMLLEHQNKKRLMMAGQQGQDKCNMTKHQTVVSPAQSSGCSRMQFSNDSTPSLHTTSKPTSGAGTFVSGSSVLSQQ